MRKLLIFSCMLFFTQLLFAQREKSLSDEQKIIDSLQIVLKNAKSDSLGCIVSFKLANIYAKNKQTGLHNVYLDKANQLIKGNQYLKDLSYYYNAIHLELNSDTQKKLLVANDRLKKYHSPEIYTIRSIIQFNIGLIYQRQNEPLQAAKILTKEAIPLAKKANNNQELANMYKFMGLIFYNTDDINKAAYYLDLAITTLEQKKIKNIGYSEDLIEVYLFYVEILSVQKKFKEAKNYIEKAEVLLKTNPKPNLYIEYYFAKGTLAQELKNYTEAIAIYNKGSELSQSKKDYISDIRFQLMIFDVLVLQKKYEEAKTLLLYLLSSKHLNIEDKLYYSKELSGIYKKLNDFSNALKYSDQYIQLNDSVNEISYKNEIANIEAKFKSKETDSKIKQLKIQKGSAELMAQNNRLKYTFFGLTTLCIIFLIGFILLYQRKKNQLAVETNQKNKQQIEILKAQKEIEVMQAMIDGEEIERKRIARELHDGIGSKLSALKIILSSQQNSPLNSHTEQLNQLLSSSISELRQISYNLIPESLTQLGLEKALNDLCHLLHSESIKIEFQAYGISPEIPISTQINIYRIVQELISNAQKHAQCSEILLSCSQNKDRFFITFEDNGIGFDINNAEQKTGSGIKNIKSRVAMLNGTFQFESNHNGTNFNIELQT